MGVAVQKGAGQGILRGDGALGQIGGGQSGQQLHNGKAAPGGTGLVRHGQR